MRTKHILTGLLAATFLVVFMLTGCSAAQPMQVAEESFLGAEAPAAPARNAELTAGASFDASIPPSDGERMVIKNADLTLVVSDPASSMDKIVLLADELGGFVVSAHLSQYQLESGIEVPQASVTIRVPAERLEQALERIRSESDRLPINQDINSQDVTSEYTDLQSRLRNLEAAEAQLTEIMQSASKTEDVLSVYNELVRVREQIEVIKGQMQYYEQSAALSAISVQLLANEAIQPLTVGSWQPTGVAKQAIQSLINTLKGLATAVIWIILFALPVLLALFIIFGLPLILLVWAIRSWRRRRSKRAMSATTPPPQEAS